MAIFNSLGSNYNLNFAIRALFSPGKKQYKSKLINFLEQKYGGKVYLTYKGRESLRLALKIINKPKEYTVGICGFTCYAVYDAVTKEGYEPEYLDIDESLNFSYETLVQAQKKNTSLKILIIQNTLGFPCDMQKIAKFCREKDIILIEDLAHSIGTKYTDGTGAGTVGDFTVLSFSQDKIIDAISGGALIVQSKNFKVQSFNFENLPIKQQLVDRFYPILTWKIRFTYAFGLGKITHFILKKFHLLSNPMGYLDSGVIYELPNWYCYLAYTRYEKLEKNLSHRKKIAKIYSEVLNENIKIKKNISRISLSANLRFPVLVKNRDRLIAFLKQNNIYISDIWYDAPIAPRRFLQFTNYKDQCPNSEKFSAEILNLPTHSNISERKAQFITEKVNAWLKNE